ncbi:MAG: IclR family transcriptional regulator [Actinomycetaceae bacterium]|nr:IclR family transcriptional regulator [Actinomycetaceae bacterium]
MVQSPGKQSVQSITRAFAILEAIADAQRDLGVTEIAERCALPLATVHRILHTLIAGGYALRTAKRTYTLGPRLIPLSRYAGGVLGIALRPMLTELVSKVDESASVAILDQDFARYISHVPSEHQMRVFAQIGNQVSLHSTGVGKAMLSTFTDDDVRAILHRSGMRKLTPATITDPDELIAELALIRERGYAFDEGEHSVGVRCVAVPIKGPYQLAVSVSAPESRMSVEMATESVVPLLFDLARKIQISIEELEAQAE